MKPAIGDLVRGKYRVERLIGDGGMGSVFEARHEALNTQVALKFLHSELAQRPGLAARFAREARVAAAIQSPHVTRVNDVDATEDGTPFIVMELLQGQSLAAVLSKEPEGRLSPEESIDFVLQILAGLEAAHGRGVVHRDLKPDNVFVTPSPDGPVIKLFDFGIAKIRESKEFSRGLTHAGILMGTPEYMAPEQLYSAAEVDHRADLYSLGVMLFEMLAGQLPADGDSAAAIVAQVQQGTAQRLDRLVPHLSNDLVEIVHKALSPDPNHRFESAYAMRQALAGLATDLSQAGQLAARRSAVTVPHPSALGSMSPSAAPQLSGAPSAGAIANGALPAPYEAPGNLPDTVPPEQPLGAGSAADEPKGTDRPGTVLTPAAPGVFVPAGGGPPGPAVRAPAPRRKASVLPWALGGLAVTLGAAIGVLVYHEQRSSDSPPPSLTPPTQEMPSASAPKAEVAPDATPDKPTSHAASAPSAPAPSAPAPGAGAGAPPAGNQTAPAQKPPPQGTGGTSQPGSTQTPPNPFGLPLPLPSNLPPLPSSLPPLPESLTSALPSSFPPIFQPPPEPPAED